MREIRKTEEQVAREGVLRKTEGREGEGIGRN